MERDRQYVLIDAAEGEQALAGRNLQQLDRAVLARRNDVRTVRAEGDGVDEVGMIGEGPLKLAADRPDADGLVEAGTGDVLTVGAEGDGEDDVVMPAHRRQQRISGNAVDAEVALAAGLATGDGEQ